MIKAKPQLEKYQNRTDQNALDIKIDSTGLILQRKGKHRDQLIVLTPREIERLRVVIS